MHIGHCRGAVVGDALANLLAKAGFAVTKEYYINDAGAQVTALAWAAYWRYLQAIGTHADRGGFRRRSPRRPAIPRRISDPGRRGTRRRFTAPRSPLRTATIAAPDVWLDIVRDFTIDAMMRGRSARTWRCSASRQDVFVSERALVAVGCRRRDHRPAAPRDGLIYEGVLEPPKGKTPDDWEPRPQTLFRATQFGDDVDRPLRKSDGSNTYFANDIAYHARQDRARLRPADRRLGRRPRRLRPAHAGGGEGASRRTRRRLEAVLCQIVHIAARRRAGRMSKRAGTYVTLRDLLEEVGRDAVRFTMLTRKADAQMEFDLDQAVAQTRDNPVFYVQYAHARCRSVLRAAAEMFGPDAVTDAALAEVARPTRLDSLTAEPELALIRRLATLAAHRGGRRTGARTAPDCVFSL